METKPQLKSYTQMLKESWAYYKSKWEALVAISLLSGIGVYIMSLAAFMSEDSPAILIVLFLAFIAYVIGLAWGFGAIMQKVYHPAENQTAGQAFTNSKKFIWPLIWTGFLGGLATVIGYILLIIPGIIVSIWVSMAAYIVVEDGQSGVPALKQSRNYVRGYWWQVFIASAFIGIVIGLPLIIIGLILHWFVGAEISGLLQDILMLIFMPLMMIYYNTVFQELKRVNSLTAAPAATPMRPVETPPASPAV